MKILIAALLLVSSSIGAEPPKVDESTRQAFQKHLEKSVKFFHADENRNKFVEGDLVVMQPDAEAKRMRPTKFTVKVSQVIDKTNLLAQVHAEWSSTVPSAASQLESAQRNTPFGFRPRVIITPPNSGEKNCPAFWVQNFKTDGLTDTSAIENVPILRCVGTKQYKTPVASNTVWLFEPFTIEDFMKEREPQKPPPLRNLEDSENMARHHREVHRQSYVQRYGFLCGGFEEGRRLNHQGSTRTAQ